VLVGHLKYRSTACPNLDVRSDSARDDLDGFSSTFRPIKASRDRCEWRFAFQRLSKINIPIFCLNNHSSLLSRLTLTIGVPLIYEVPIRAIDPSCRDDIVRDTSLRYPQRKAADSPLFEVEMSVAFVRNEESLHSDAQ